MQTKEKKYNIGLVIGNIEDDFSNRICKGAMKAAEETGDNLFVFPAKYIGRGDEYQLDPKLQFEYQYNILLKYAQSCSLDVVLIALSCIGYKTTHENCMKVLRQYTDVPVVLLSSQEEEHLSFVFDNAKGMREAVTYLLHEKKVQKLGVVMGEANNMDMQQRMAAVQEVMDRENLPLPKERIVYMDYSDKGKERLADWWDKNQDLEAIVCFSDFFALYMYDILAKTDRVIGKDIFLTGYDNIQESVYASPPLATVNADAVMFGYEGVRQVHDRLRRGEKMNQGCVRLDTNFVLRESASGQEQTKPVAARGTAFDYKRRIQNMIDMNHQMNIVNRDMLMFTNGNAKNYVQILKAFSMDNIPSCYLYLFKEPFENYDSMEWDMPDHLYLQGYRIGKEVYELPKAQQRMPVDELFHNKYLPQKRHTYVVIDIYSRQQQYGIVMCEIPYNYLHYVEMICYQLSTAIKIMELFSVQEQLLASQTDMLRKLEEKNLLLDDISNKDELTGICNRRGFITQVKHQLTDADNYYQKALVIYMDLNYLKRINDSFGHNEGDYAICSCGQILEECLGANGIAGRVGGDEFAGFVVTEEEPAVIRERIKQKFEEHNNISGKPYRLMASAGILAVELVPGMDLKQLLDQADDLLYDDKLHKGPFECQSTT